MSPRLFIVYFLLLLSASAAAQYPRFSLATDIGMVHNFPQRQRFTTFSNTVITDFHLVKKDGIRVSFMLCRTGTFDNLVMATSNGAQPPLGYTNNSKLRFRQLSVGWKHYLVGEPITEYGWNLFFTAGFGLQMGRVDNSTNPMLDTTGYTPAVKFGTGKFKRLTYDLSLGWEKAFGADFSLYTEARLLIPSTDYPSEYLLINKKAPFAGLICGGLRILF